MRDGKMELAGKVKRTGIPVLGSVLAAVVASACCVGPALLALIGAGTVGISGVLGAYRPYFIGISALLLGIAFYLTYRKREIICEDGTCKTVRGGKWDKIGVWFAAVVAAAVIAIPSITAAHAAGAAPSKGGPAGYGLAAGSSAPVDSCCEVRKASPETKPAAPRTVGSTAAGSAEQSKGNSK